MASIEIKNLSKKFGNFKAVDNISFEVKKNCVFGFLGPNGAGKTTAIRMMTGLSKPSDGSIKIAEEDVVFGNANANRNFGYLPEQPSFYTWMTGKEYLSFVADIFEIKNKSERIEKLLATVNLTSSQNKKIGTYSNGMKQRLGIAQALVNDPKVLIMDEPVSALDPIGRKEVLFVIEELKKEKTIFMSTHILSDVDRICDDVAIINKGKIVTLSPLSLLKEKYAKTILEIEFRNDPEKIISEIKKQNFTEKLEKNGNLLRIWLKDEKAMDDNTPLKFLAKQNNPVLRYGLNLPEIEDLFVEIVKEGK